MKSFLKWLTFPLSFLAIYYARNILFVLVYAIFTWLQTFSTFWLVFFLIVIGIALLYYGWIMLLVVLGGLGKAFAKWMPNKYIFLVVIVVQFVSYILLYLSNYNYPKIMNLEDIAVALGIPVWADAIMSLFSLGLIAVGGLGEYNKNSSVG